MVRRPVGAYHRPRNTFAGVGKDERFRGLLRQDDHRQFRRPHAQDVTYTAGVAAADASEDRRRLILVPAARPTPVDLPSPACWSCEATGNWREG